MARVFSINFVFEDKPCTAIVNLRQHEHDMSFQVNYIDKHLQQILSGEVLVFSLAEGLKHPAHLPNSLAEELVLNTTEAISDYLKVKEIY